MRLEMIEILPHLVAVETVPRLGIFTAQWKQSVVTLGNHGPDRTCARRVVGIRLG
jgi:hypothetical protein